MTDDLIVSEIVARLADIQMSGGYFTDAGLTVFSDGEFIDDGSNSMPCLSVIDSDESEFGDSDHGDITAQELKIDVFGWIKSQNNRAELARKLISDIKQSICRSSLDRRLLNDAHSHLLINDIKPVSRVIELPSKGGDLITVKVSFVAVYFEKYA